MKRLFDKHYPLKSLCHKAKLYVRDGLWHCKECKNPTSAWTNGVKT